MDLIPDSKQLEDDAKESEVKLIEHRIPFLSVGLIGGMVLTLFSSRFEGLLAQNINLVFFIPVIVYMSGAVGTQAETIYIRNIGRRQLKFSTYLFKEFFSGIALGIVFGLAIGLFAYFWLNSFKVALTVGTAMLVNVALAPILALFIAKFLQKEKSDPALGAGPFTTVLEDIISLGIYFLVASIIIFN